jgi:predicted transcriptional regulator
MIHAMLKADSKTDWWDELEEDEKASIQRGLDDLDKGRTISHEEVVKKHGQWLSR